MLSLTSNTTPSSGSLSRLSLQPTSELREKDRDILEEHRAIDPSSQAGVEFQAAMEKIFTRLATARETTNETTSRTLSEKHLGTAVELAEQEVIFLLSDKTEVGASIYTKQGLYEKATLVISKGLLSVLETEDQLAWVIGHEATHLVIRSALPLTTSSQGEELLADLSSLYTLYRAGYDPREGREILKILHNQEKNQGLIGNLFQSFDVHGRTLHRISAAELSLTKLSREEGGIHRTKTPLIIEGFKDAAHEGFIERYLKHSRYQECDIDAQYNQLQELIPHLTNNARASDFLFAFRKLVQTSPSPSEEILCDLLLEGWNVLPKGTYGQPGSKSLYVAALKVLWERAQERSPVGWMREWASAIEDLKRSRTMSEAREVAASILKMSEVRVHPLHRKEEGGTGILGSLFRLETPEEELLETLRRVEWPKISGQTRAHLLTLAEADSSHTLRNAMFEMGILSDRLFALYTTEELLHLKPSPLITRKDFDEYKAKHLKARHLGIVDQAYLDELIARGDGRVDAKVLEEIVDILELNEATGGELDLTGLRNLRFSDREARTTLERFAMAVIHSTHLEKDEKLTILLGTCYHMIILDDILQEHSLGTPYCDIEETRLDELREIIGYDRPSTEGEVSVALDKIARLYSRLPDGGMYRTDFQRTISGIEVLQYLTTDEREPLSFDTIFNAASLGAGRDFLQDGWRDLLTLELFRQIEDTTPLETLIRLTKIFESEGWFAPTVGSKPLYELILQRMEKLPENERGRALLMALAGDRVADPDLRTKLIDSWVEIQSNKLGKDTGAREYFDMVKAISREVDYTSIEIYRYGYVNKYDGLELQKRLSARITAQREVALLLEPDIKITAKDFELSQLFGASGQAVATLLEYDKKLNRDFIVFLSEPVTDSSISDLHESLIAAGSGTGVSTEFLKRQGILDRINHRSLLHLHKNFWGEPLVWPSSPRF